MPEIDQLILAIVTGALFGYFIHLYNVSTAKMLPRVAILLFSLWALQSLSQHILRYLDGRDVSREVVITGTLRLAFGLTALVVLWLVERRR